MEVFRSALKIVYANISLSCFKYFLITNKKANTLSYILWYQVWSQFFFYKKICSAFNRSRPLSGRYIIRKATTYIKWLMFSTLLLSKNVCKNLTIPASPQKLGSLNSGNRQNRHILALHIHYTFKTLMFTWNYTDWKGTNNTAKSTWCAVLPCTHHFQQDL